jgi:hypothetical protein
MSFAAHLIEGAKHPSIYPGVTDLAVLTRSMIKDMVWATIIALTAVSASNVLLWAWEAL